MFLLVALLTLFMLEFLLLGLLSGVLFKFALGFYAGKFKERFVCYRCGNCCKLRTGQTKFVNGRCEHLVGTNFCNIYDSRPKVCREFPFKKVFGKDYMILYLKCKGQRELFKELFLRARKQKS